MCYGMGRNHPLWGGYEGLSGYYWSRVKYGSKKRKLELSITIEDAWNQFIKQDKKCALTGIPLIFDTKSSAYDGNASLDRIDSNKGYTIDNIQWLEKHINMMKQEYSETDFVNYCKLVYLNSIK